MWSMILLMSRLPGGHSKSAGYNSAKQYESRSTASCVTD